MLDPYTYRCPAGHPDPCPVCSGAPHLEEILQYEGPHTVAAVILETVVGTNGIIVPPDGYLQSIRETCDRHGILLICDEVMAGFGRTGKWFACENWDVVPDILTVAKGINSGYVPLGAMVVSEPIADQMRDRFLAGGLTYSGHPLACASAVASIEAFQEEGIVENAAEQGDVPGRRRCPRSPRSTRRSARCAGSASSGASSSCKTARRARCSSRSTRAARRRRRWRGCRSAALEAGLYLMTHWNVVMVVPPLTITREELDEGLAVLDERAIADEYRGSAVRRIPKASASRPQAKSTRSCPRRRRAAGRAARRAGPPRPR